jgi:hypothetical protein
VSYFVVLEPSGDDGMERRRKAKWLMREYEEKAIKPLLRTLSNRLEEERKIPNSRSAVNRTTERRCVALCEVRRDDADGERSGFVDE